MRLQICTCFFIFGDLIFFWGRGKGQQDFLIFSFCKVGTTHVSMITIFGESLLRPQEIGEASPLPTKSSKTCVKFSSLQNSQQPEVLTAIRDSPTRAAITAKMEPTETSIYSQTTNKATGVFRPGQR